jgi:hypothetical protein
MKAPHRLDAWTLALAMGTGHVRIRDQVPLRKASISPLMSLCLASLGLDVCGLE